VNTGGVIPIIFAVSIIQFPQYLASAFKSDFMKKLADQLAMGQPLYNLFYALAIIFFCYFYISIIFNPTDTAENMRKYGGFIPGIRPGKATSDYIDSVLTRITLIGALYLTIVALIPEFLLMGFKVQSIPGIGPWLDSNLPNFITQGLGVPFYFGGTSLLIVVGVAMDTVQQIESQLVMRNYDGFLKKGRIRGRRG
jgi:preprotein translocase subunit SecY